MARKTDKPITTPTLPADAIGFLGRRQDRPERLAFFMANGSLSATFSPDDTADSLRDMFATRGLVVDAQGIVTRAG
jgi:hypothetical protein